MRCSRQWRKFLKNPGDILIDQTNWGTAKSDYGQAIEEEVINFYNLFSPPDNLLEPKSQEAI